MPENLDSEPPDRTGAPENQSEKTGQETCAKNRVFPVFPVLWSSVFYSFLTFTDLTCSARIFEAPC
jgi:hypothetical protein